MLLWHEQLPTRYSIIERFNHRSVTGLPDRPATLKTLEIGAGIGGHLPFEDLSRQEYHCLELREELCAILESLDGIASVCAANIENRTPFDDGSFDRVVAIHVLEHIRNLPSAIVEVGRILADDGFFDVVLPCEGGLAYSLARQVSAKRFFEKTFGMSYDPIIANEHVNTLDDVVEELSHVFIVESARRFPLNVPIDTINLCVAFRLRKRRA